MAGWKLEGIITLRARAERSFDEHEPPYSPSIPSDFYLFCVILEGYTAFHELLFRPPLHFVSAGVES